MDLAGIRKALDSLLSTDTILLGHALDNDLKTLRIVHHRCVDTALIFPHRAGPPYRRSLKDLCVARPCLSFVYSNASCRTKEKLGKTIQVGTGDITVGHSSLEDAIATLDLVRWHILDMRRLPGAASRS